MEKLIDCHEFFDGSFETEQKKIIITKRKSPWEKTESEVLTVNRKLPLNFISLALDYLAVNNIEPDTKNLRICYYDLECDDRDPSFDLRKKKILCAAFIDSENRETFIIENDEKLLLRKVQKLFEMYDVMIGYNNINFDFPLLETRGELYNIHFKKYSRKNVDLIKLMDKFNNINIIMSTANLPNFSLDTVGEHFLKLGKIDIRTGNADTRYGGTIMKLFESNKELLKKYNLRDVEITKKLDEHFNITKTAKILSEISSTLFIDTCKSISNNIEMYLIKEILKKDEKTQEFLFKKLEECHESAHHPYEGALNYLKEPGFYDKIAIYDFKSMYPNIVRTFNISFETITKEIENEDDIKQLLFKPKGLLSEISDNLQKERMKYKKAGQKTQEVGIKLISNSLYGYWGSQWSDFRKVDIASGITWIGRYLLELLIDKYPDTCYADTDSIFVTLPKNKNIKEFEREINNFLEFKILETFPNLKNTNTYHLHLEFEKLFSKLILVSKKKYIGHVIVDDKDKRDFLYGKGIELVRRDYTIYGKRLLNHIIKKILLENPSEDEIRKYIIEEKKIVLTNQVPIKELGITQKLTKLPSEYKMLPLHARISVEDSKKGVPYFIGQRITYIVTGKDRKNNLTGKSLHSMRENDKYSTNIYWEDKIYPMIERLLEVVFPNDDWKYIRNSNSNLRQLKLI